MADGQAEQTGYDGLINEMRDNGITRSCIAVGRDADAALLQSLSQKANGRYYYTDEFTDLPRIFTKETNLAGKTYIRNQTFSPAITSHSPILGDIQAIPMLDGYIATSPKDMADVILMSPDGHPVLAAWLYGLGRSVAWTSDLHNQWISQWLGMENGAAILRNALSWVLRDEGGRGGTLTLSQKDGQCKLILTLPQKEQSLKIDGTAVDSENHSIPLDFQNTAPGIYEAAFDQNGKPPEPGTYVVGLQLHDENDENAELTDISAVLALGVCVPYGPEYDIQNNQNGQALLEKLSFESGGRVLQSPDQVFVPLAQSAYSDYDYSAILLLLALILLLPDIAFRRFPSLAENIKFLGRIMILRHRKDASAQKSAGKRAWFNQISKQSASTVGNHERSVKKSLPNAEAKLSGKNAEAVAAPPHPKTASSALPARNAGANASTSNELLERMRKRKVD